MPDDNLNELLEQLNIEHLNKEEKQVLRQKIFEKLGYDESLDDELGALQKKVKNMDVDLPLSDLLELNNIIKSKLATLEFEEDTELELQQLKIQESQLRQEQEVLRSKLLEIHSHPLYLNPYAPESPPRVLARVEAYRASQHQQKRPPSQLEQFQLENSIFDNTKHIPADQLENSIVRGLKGEYYSKLPANYPGYAEMAHDIRNPLVESIIQNQVLTYCNAHGIPVNQFSKLNRYKLLLSQPVQKKANYKQPKLHTSQVGQKDLNQGIYSRILGQNDIIEEQYQNIVNNNDQERNVDSLLRYEQLK